MPIKWPFERTTASAAILLLAMVVVNTSLAQEAPPSTGKTEDQSSSSKAGSSARTSNIAKNTGAEPKLTDVVTVSRPNRARKSPQKVEIIKPITKPPTNHSSVTAAKISPTVATGDVQRNSIGQPLAKHPISESLKPVTLPSNIPTAQNVLTSNVATQGATVANHSDVQGAVSGIRNTGVSVVTTAVANRSIISGTGISRTGSGPGIVRGTANVAVGTINGTNLKPRH